jgi:hypothetical protein
VNEDWSFVKTMFIGQNKEEVCHECSNYVLGPESDLILWWNNISSSNVKADGN